LFTGFLILPPFAFSGAAADDVSLDAGFRQMYNLDFQTAHRTFEAWAELHPDDPLGPAANAAAYLFAEFDRLNILQIELFTDNKRIEKFRSVAPDATIRNSFEVELAKADQIAADVLSESPKDPNALFAQVLANGLRGDYAALIDKRNGDGLRYLKKSRVIAEKLLVIDPDYYDAYLAVGIENYLLGLRRAPMRWILRLSGAQTNKDQGIAKLKVTAEKGRYLAPYARLLLAIAALRNRDRDTAKELLAALAQEFPQNRLYRNELARLQG
jgi:hypothetical protein